MDNEDNIEFIINNELNRLKEEEKTLKNALFLKTRKYLFNNNLNNPKRFANLQQSQHINFNNQVEVINHAGVDYDRLKWSNSSSSTKHNNNNNNNNNSTSRSNSSKLDSIRNGLKYFDDLDANMHDCHLCSTSSSSHRNHNEENHNNNDLTRTSSFWESSNEFLDSYLRATQSTLRKQRMSPHVQDLNKQQNLQYYDHKKYIKPVNHVSFKDTVAANSNSIVSDYRRDIIRPETAIGRPRTAIEREYYSAVDGARNSNTNRKSLESTTLNRSGSSTLFYFEENKKSTTGKEGTRKPAKPWHYTTATLYPHRDRILKKDA